MAVIQETAKQTVLALHETHQPNLDNPTEQPQNTPFLEEETEMAKRHKVRIEIGKTPEGTPDFKWVDGYTNQEMILNAAKALIAAGVVTAQEQPRNGHKPVRFKPYAQKWKCLYKDGKKKHTTLSEYESILNRHLYPAFGDMDIRDITIDDVQAFMNRNAHYAAKTIKEMRLVLGMVLEAAREDGIISINPARSSRLSNPSTKVTKRTPLTSEEAADVIAHMGELEQERDRQYVALLMFTGMRRNEVLGLRWEDIDFDTGRIHVQRGVTFKGNQPVVSTPKTAAGIRAIPLHPQLAPYLEPRKAGGYVIGNGDTPVTQQMVKRMWWRIEHSINVYGKTPHYFRHTFVTFARRVGMDEKTLQTIGGYADITTMRNVYTHTLEDDIQDASLQMGTMYAAK